MARQEDKSFVSQSGDFEINWSSDWRPVKPVHEILNRGRLFSGNAGVCGYLWQKCHIGANWHSLDTNVSRQLQWKWPYHQ